MKQELGVSLFPRRQLELGQCSSESNAASPDKQRQRCNFRCFGRPQREYYRRRKALSLTRLPGGQSWVIEPSL